MTMQQINLYQAEFRKQKQPLDAKLLINVVIVVSVLLVMVYGFNYWSLLQARQQLGQLHQQKTSAEQQLVELKKTHQPLLKNPRLAEDIKRYQSWVDTRQQALNILSAKSFGNTQGFAEYFSGLARQKIDGLWLTGLSFAEGGRQLGLQGSALKPELVPRFLQRLSGESVFTGTRFHSLVMSREKEKDQQVDFQLRSVDEEGGDAS
ncbi:MAG: PilN domain-containing protein [Thioalkalispiraceae bacterium]|jgi:hypothetical protein